MTQITLRKVPNELADRLREAAKSDGKSMNTLALELLAEQLGTAPRRRRKRRDLSKYAGAWTQKEADEFARATATFDQIDEDVWQ